MDDIELFLKNEKIGYYEKNFNLKKILTMKTSGTAQYYCIPNSMLSLEKLIEFCDLYHHTWLVVGNGSNIITYSTYQIEIVIHFRRMKSWYKIEENYLYVSASVLMPGLSRNLALQGYKNLEYFSGIPGTIGGMIIMNAGAYKHTIGEFVESVLILNEKGKYELISLDKLGFDYRFSSLAKRKCIVISAKIRLIPTNENLLEKIKKWDEYRKRTQPLEFPNSGSIFKNGSNFYAWTIIDQLGYRGYRIGDAMISPKHSNFIINVGNATGEQIENIILLIQEDALLKFHLLLQKEIILLK